MSAADIYVSSIRNKAKREYAKHYLEYLRHDEDYSTEPEHPGLTVMAAQAVRIQLRSIAAKMGIDNL